MLLITIKCYNKHIIPFKSKIMDKYQALFNYAKNQSDFPIKMTFEQIEKLLTFPIDHSF